MSPIPRDPPPLTQPIQPLLLDYRQLQSITRLNEQLQQLSQQLQLLNQQLYQLLNHE